MRYIYVIAATNGYLKIGHASLPFERYSMLQTGSPLPLTLEYLLQCPNAAALEAAVHAQLRPFHRHREWFEIPVDKVVALIRLFATDNYRIAPAAHRMRTKGAPPRYRATITETAIADSE